MKKNMLRLLSALAITSMLCGSLEINAMRTGWWNSTRNTARTWWNKPNVQQNVKPVAFGVGAGTTFHYGAKAINANAEYDRRYQSYMAQERNPRLTPHYWETNRREWAREAAGRTGFNARSTARQEREQRAKQSKQEIKQWKRDYDLIAPKSIGKQRAKELHRNIDKYNPGVY